MSFRRLPTYFQDNPVVLPQVLFWLLLEKAGGKLHASWLREIDLFEGLILKREYIYFTSEGLSSLDVFKRRYPAVELTIQGVAAWLLYHSDLLEIIAKYPKNNLELTEVLELADDEERAGNFIKYYIDSFDPHSVISSLSRSQPLALQEMLWFDFAEYAAEAALKNNDWRPITPTQLNYHYGLSNYFKPTETLRCKYGLRRKSKKAN